MNGTTTHGLQCLSSRDPQPGWGQCCRLASCCCLESYWWQPWYYYTNCTDLVPVKLIRVADGAKWEYSPRPRWYRNKKWTLLRGNSPWHFSTFGVSVYLRLSHSCRCYLPSGWPGWQGTVLLETRVRQVCLRPPYKIGGFLAVTQTHAMCSVHLGPQNLGHRGTDAHIKPAVPYLTGPFSLTRVPVCCYI